MDALESAKRVGWTQDRRSEPGCWFYSWARNEACLAVLSRNIFHVLITYCCRCLACLDPHCLFGV